MYSENEIAKLVVNICYQIHSKFGPGLFESVYEELINYELRKTGVTFITQKPIALIHDDVKLELGFRADFIIENKVILELKSVETLAPVHYRQIQTYLKLTNLKLGLLINFNVQLIKDGIHRVVNNF